MCVDVEGVGNGERVSNTWEAVDDGGELVMEVVKTEGAGVPL